MSIVLGHKDWVPKFLDFWRAAATITDEAERWRLWQELYGFAAVPPTPYGQELARRLLQEAWSRYPDVIDRLPAAVEALQADLPAIADQVATLFELDRPVEVNLLTFVGGFEGNAFVAYSNLCVPVEVAMPPFVLAHEVIHRVHATLCAQRDGWRRTIAMLLLEEGLAMRGSQALYPEVPAVQHLSHTDPAWVQACEARHAQILAGALPYLSQDDDELLLRFTMQEGPAGLIREGYWAGWHTVGHLLAEGWSLARLARVHESEAAPIVAGALRRALGQ